jgi:hypothetical protein
LLPSSPSLFPLAAKKKKPSQLLLRPRPLLQLLPRLRLQPQLLLPLLMRPSLPMLPLRLRLPHPLPHPLLPTRSRLLLMLPRLPPRLLLMLPRPLPRLLPQRSKLLSGNKKPAFMAGFFSPRRPSYMLDNRSPVKSRRLFSNPNPTR